MNTIVRAITGLAVVAAIFFVVVCYELSLVRAALSTDDERQTVYYDITSFSPKFKSEYNDGKTCRVVKVGTNRIEYETPDGGIWVRVRYR